MDKHPAGTTRGWVRRFNLNVFSPHPREFWDLITGADGELEVRKRPRPVGLDLPDLAPGYGGGRNSICNLNAR